MLVYSLFLLFALKLRRDPFITIPLFMGLCVAFFYLDRIIRSVTMSGYVVQIIMIFKLAIFFFFLFFEFFDRRNLLKLLVTAGTVSLLSFGIYLGAHMLIFERTDPESYGRREAGMYLLRLGFRFPVLKLKDQAMRSGDPEYLKEYLSYARRNHVDLDYSDEEWERLLFSGSVDTAEMIAGYLRHRVLPLTYDKIIGFAESRSFAIGSHLENAPAFTRLAARYVKGNEADLEKRMRTAGTPFIRWGMSLAGESRSPLFIPFLLEYLTGPDSALAYTAYGALTRITGMDPREKLNLRINDPEAVAVFKDYYVRTRTGF